MNEWTVFTDGACSGNPGPGGWGVLAISGQDVNEWYAPERETTNNQMELMAAIMALRHLPCNSKISLFSDSKYVIDGITEWLPGWKKREWRTAAGKPVKNKELWQELEALSDGRAISWQWVRGHVGNAGNERADELARRGMSGAIAVPEPA